MLLTFSFVIFLIVILISLYFTIRLGFDIYISAQGPFFAPSTDQRIKDILTLAQAKTTDKIADLGSGDGRVLIAFAKKGIMADGYEIDPFLVYKSRKLIQKLQLNNLINIKQQSFWKADLSQYDVIVIYGIGYIMGKLETKLKREIKKSCRVVSVYFKFPNWQPKKHLHDINIYQY